MGYGKVHFSLPKQNHFRGFYIKKTVYKTGKSSFKVQKIHEN